MIGHFRVRIPLWDLAWYWHCGQSYEWILFFFLWMKISEWTGADPIDSTDTRRQRIVTSADLPCLKLLLLEIQTQTKNINTIYRTLDKKMGQNRIKNRTDLPASNYYYCYFLLEILTHTQVQKKSDTKYGTLRKRNINIQKLPKTLTTWNTNTRRRQKQSLKRKRCE